jgi:hypothetical protein
VIDRGLPLSFPRDGADRPVVAFITSAPPPRVASALLAAALAAKQNPGMTALRPLSRPPCALSNP